MGTLDTQPRMLSHSVADMGRSNYRIGGHRTASECRIVPHRTTAVTKPVRKYQLFYSKYCSSSTLIENGQFLTSYTCCWVWCRSAPSGLHKIVNLSLTLTLTLNLTKSLTRTLSNTSLAILSPLRALIHQTPYRYCLDIIIA